MQNIRKYAGPLIILVLLAMVLSYLAPYLFKGKPAPQPPQSDTLQQVDVQVPDFNPANAFAYIEKQVSFGPRKPNTPAHEACGAWLVDTLKGLGATVIEQNTQIKAYTGELLNVKNIIAQYNPEATNRFMLCAHWDTRHVADEETDPAKQKQPVIGADDGGSGVGVLLEIARLLQANPIMANVGVDLILFDAEDYGEQSSVVSYNQRNDTWCLGSQYWARNPHVPGYKARWGILLDMVGAKDARFPKEEFSRNHNEYLVERVWQEASILGFSGYFQNVNVNPIIDDHVYVNLLNGTKTIDIINLPGGQRTFGPHWHTLNDNMSIISKNTLEAVGQTVISVLYKEAALLQ
jgi:hypothetical protein